MSPGGWALRGEHTLWTGRPANARATAAEAGGVLYVAVALAVVTVFLGRGLRYAPEIVKLMTAGVWGAGVLQLLGMLVILLVIEPRRRRRTAYEVTNYRVIAMTGPDGRDATSVYLDQIGEPAVRRSRDGTGDVLLRARSGGARGEWVTRLFQSSPFGLGAVYPLTMLRAVPGAEQACQAISEARRRMLAGQVDVFSSPGQLAGPGLPAGIVPGAGEDVLWAGEPARIPWWFGSDDILQTVFMVVFLAFVVGMCVFIVQYGNAAFLAFLVPFALAGGVYPAAGRVIHRRLLIKRSRYVLTSHRLITTWRPLHGGTPVVVQAWHRALLPPALRGSSVFAGPALADGSSRRRGWKQLTWPASTVTPPAFIGLASAPEVAGLIGAAQVAARAPVSR